MFIGYTEYGELAMQTLKEPIDAFVIYRRGAPHPLLRAFRWGTNRYDVTSVNLVHRERVGAAVTVCYAVSCGTDHFSICYDPIRGEWALAGIDTDR